MPLRTLLSTTGIISYPELSASIASGTLREARNVSKQLEGGGGSLEVRSGRPAGSVEDASRATRLRRVEPKTVRLRSRREPILAG
jgi:hypothetical protein